MPPFPHSPPPCHWSKEEPTFTLDSMNETLQWFNRGRAKINITLLGFNGDIKPRKKDKVDKIGVKRAQFHTT